MEKLSVDQKKIISKIAKENGFDEFEVIVKSGSDKGDNFMGVILNVSIKNGDKVLDLVLKSAFAHEGSGKNFLASTIYKKEIYMYEKLFAEYDKIQKEFNIKHRFDGYAKVHGSFVGNNEGFLIMDDLRKHDFKLWNKKLAMNAEHATAVVKEYAKFHSLGMILKFKKPELFEEIKKNITIPWESQVENENSAFNDYFTILAGKWLGAIKGNKQATEVVSAFLPKLGDYYMDATTNPDYDLTVIHGDCWCNNIMFKYKNPRNESAPTEVCLLDWQLSKIGTPAVDLNYYFFTTLDKEQITNYKHYLTIYYDILSDNLASAGLHPEQIYSYSQLEADFKKFAFSGLMPALTILITCFADKDAVPDMSNIEDIMKLFSLKLENEDEYNKRITDIVEFMIENNSF